MYFFFSLLKIGNRSTGAQTFSVACPIGVLSDSVKVTFVALLVCFLYRKNASLVVFGLYHNTTISQFQSYNLVIKDSHHSLFRQVKRANTVLLNAIFNVVWLPNIIIKIQDFIKKVFLYRLQNTFADDYRQINFANSQVWKQIGYELTQLVVSQLKARSMRLQLCYLLIQLCVQSSAKVF